MFHAPFHIHDCPDLSTSNIRCQNPSARPVSSPLSSTRPFRRFEGNDSTAPEPGRGPAIFPTRGIFLVICGPDILGEFLPIPFYGFIPFCFRSFLFVTGLRRMKGVRTSGTLALRMA